MHAVIPLIIIATLVNPALVPFQQRRAAMSSFQQGLTALQEQHYYQASKFFEQAVEQNPDWGNPKLELAYTLRLMGGDIETRQQIVDSGSQQLKRNARYLYESALVARDKQDYTLAIQLLYQALDVRPEYHEARLELAYLEQQQGNHQVSLKLYLDLKEIYGNNHAYFVVMAQAARSVGETAIEEEALKKAVELSDSQPMMLVRLRDFYKRENRLTELKQIENKINQQKTNTRPKMRDLPPAKR